MLGWAFALTLGLGLPLARPAGTTLLMGQESASVGREPADAEYAVRWDPSEGGFANAEEVLDFLGAPKVRGETYEVQYFDLPPPENAPPGSTVILRRRRKAGGGSEIRLKYRREAPLAGNWGCPGGRGFEPREEVDFSFTGSGEPGRVYSYSCTLKAGEPPELLAAIPKKCVSRIARYVFGGFKIEEWTLPGGGMQLEVSRSAANTAGEFARFERFVSKLLERGIRPSPRSKTELGSQCAEGNSGSGRRP
jgi:hypothetical protein